MRRIAICFALFVLCAATIAAGGRQEVAGASAAVTAPGMFPIVNTPVTLKAFVGMPAYVQDLRTNEFTLWYEEKTGVRIDWEDTPATQALEKANVVIASGDYPDFFIHVPFSRIQAVLYGNSGVFIRLNELIDKHGLHMLRMFEDSPYSRDSITDNSGNIYGFPSLEECYHCSGQQKLWIYRPWLEKLGKGIPQTTDELYDVLKAFKSNDMNGNGNAGDEVPLVGAIRGAWNGNVIGFLMTPFIYHDYTYLMLENGKVKFVPDQPGWKEGLLYIRKLYEEGLIAPESFTQDGAQLKQLAENPGLPLVGAVPAGHIGVFATIYGDSGRYMEFDGVPPLKGPTGLRQAAHFPYVANMHIFVTPKSRHPEVLTRWVDWFYSFEGNISSGPGGIEGVRWAKVADGRMSYAGIPARWEMTYPDRPLPYNHSWGHVAPHNHPVSVREAEFRPAHPSGYDNEVKLWQVQKTYDPFLRQEVLPTLFYTQQQAEEIAEIKVTIETYVAEHAIQFITGVKSIDRDWNTYVNGFARLNVSRYLEVVQQAFNARPK